MNNVKNLEGVWVLSVKASGATEPTQKCVTVQDSLITGGDEKYYWLGNLEYEIEHYKSGNGKATLTRQAIACNVVLTAHAVKYHHWTGEIYPNSIFNVAYQHILVRCEGEYFSRNNTLKMHGILLSDPTSNPIMIEGRHVAKLDDNHLQELVNQDVFDKLIKENYNH